MSFTVKDWKDWPDQTTPMSADALKDLERRVTNYSDLVTSHTYFLHGVKDAGLIAGDVTKGSHNYDAFVAMAARAKAHVDADENLVWVYLPRGRYYIEVPDGSPSIDCSGIRFLGDGAYAVDENDRTIIQMTPQHLGGVFGVPDEGAADVEFHNIDFFGDFENNIAYNTQFTLMVDAPFRTSGTLVIVDNWDSYMIPSITVDDTSDLPAAGEAVALVPIGGNAVYISWESKDATHLYNVTYIGQSNSTPQDITAPFTWRMYTGVAGWIRFNHFNRVRIYDCQFRKTLSYVIGLGSHAFQGDVSKIAFYMFGTTVSGSLGADTLDCKGQWMGIFMQNELFDAHDKGINVRGPLVYIVNNDIHDIHASAITLANNSTVSPSPSFELAADITTAVGQTVTCPLARRANFPESGYLWVSTEKCSFTRPTGSGVITLTGRGLDGTTAIAWKQSSGARPVFVRAEITENPTDPSLSANSYAVTIHNNKLYNCEGGGVRFAGSGTGLMTFSLTSNAIYNNDGFGVIVSSTQGRVRGTISGNEIFNNSGGGIQLVGVESISMMGGGCWNNTGPGVEIRCCGNGVHIGGMHILNNSTWGIDAGTTDEVPKLHVDGILYRAAGLLGPIRVADNSTLTGSAFIARQHAGHRPHKEVETFDRRLANFNLPLNSGVLYVARVNPSVVQISRLAVDIATYNNTGVDHSKLAIGKVTDAGDWTLIGATADGTSGGGVISTEGWEDYSIAAAVTYWTELYENVALAVWATKAAATELAVMNAFMPGAAEHQMSWRPFISGWLPGQAAMPATATIKKSQAMTCGVTNGSSEVTTGVGEAANLVPGLSVYGAGIAQGRYIVDVGTDKFYMNDTARATAAGVAVTAYMEAIPYLSGVSGT